MILLLGESYRGRTFSVRVIWILFAFNSKLIPQDGNSCFLILQRLTQLLLLGFHGAKRDHFLPPFAHIHLFFFDELRFRGKLDLCETKVA